MYIGNSRGCTSPLRQEMYLVVLQVLRNPYKLQYTCLSWR